MRKIYFTLIDGYVNGHGSTPSDEVGEIELELPDNHDFFMNDSNVFKYVNGKLIKDEERRKQILSGIEINTPTADDLNALAMLELAETMNAR